MSSNQIYDPYLVTKAMPWENVSGISWDCLRRDRECVRGIRFWVLVGDHDLNMFAQDLPSLKKLKMEKAFSRKREGLFHFAPFHNSILHPFTTFY